MSREAKARQAAFISIEGKLLETFGEQPIRNAVPMMLGVIVVAAVTFMPFAYSWEFRGIPFGLLAWVGLVAGYWYALCRMNPFDWFLDYWRHNIQGYFVCYNMTADGELNRYAWPDSNKFLASAPLPPRQPFTLYLPLGGWFAKPRFFVETLEITGSWLSSPRWRITVRRRGREAPLQWDFRVKDLDGDRVTLSVGDILRIAPCVWTEESANGTWRRTLCSLSSCAPKKKGDEDAPRLEGVTLGNTS